MPFYSAFAALPSMVSHCSSALWSLQQKHRKCCNTAIKREKKATVVYIWMLTMQDLKCLFCFLRKPPQGPFKSRPEKWIHSSAGNPSKQVAFSRQSSQVHCLCFLLFRLPLMKQWTSFQTSWKKMICLEQTTTNVLAAKLGEKTNCLKALSVEAPSTSKAFWDFTHH